MKQDSLPKKAVEPVDNLAVLDPDVVVDQLAITHNTNIGDLPRLMRFVRAYNVIEFDIGAFLGVARDSSKSTPAT